MPRQSMFTWQAMGAQSGRCPSRDDRLVIRDLAVLGLAREQVVQAKVGVNPEVFRCRTEHLAVPKFGERLADDAVDVERTGTGAADPSIDKDPVLMDGDFDAHEGSGMEAPSGVDDPVGDRIGDLVRVSGPDKLGRSEVPCGHGASILPCWLVAGQAAPGNDSSVQTSV